MRPAIVDSLFHFYPRIQGQHAKPFEASLLLNTIKPLVSEAQLARGLFVEQVSRPVPPQPPSPSPPSAPNLDPERVEAAITLALDAALPALVREITERVLIALGH